MGVAYAGENALARYDAAAYQQIVAQSDVNGQRISAFSYLRLTPELLQGDNLANFQAFVASMHNLR